MRAAILIDGAYFLMRFPSLNGRHRERTPEQVDELLGKLVDEHLRCLNDETIIPAQNPYALLYRCFFYDAPPYTGVGHYPISGKAINYAKSPTAIFRNKLFELIRKRASFALRLGEVRRDPKYQWMLKGKTLKDLIAGRRQISDLTDDDFFPNFRQKAVDMRIGADISSITLKKQADTIVLIAGDSDFVPVAKQSRREGARIILDPLGQHIHPGLLEHVDLLRDVLTQPKDTKPE